MTQREGERKKSGDRRQKPSPNKTLCSLHEENIKLSETKASQPKADMLTASEDQQKQLVTPTLYKPAKYVKYCILNMQFYNQYKIMSWCQ